MGKKGHKKILVMRLSAMGDVAMMVPVLLALHKEYPQLQVVLVTRKRFFPIFSDLPFVSPIEADVEGRHKGLFGVYRLFLELKKMDLHAVADMHNVLRSKFLCFLFRLAGIPLAQLDKGRAEKRALIANPPGQLPFLKPTHQRYADVFVPLGFAINGKEEIFLQKKIWLPTVPLQKKHPLIGIAPFASFKGKQYPLRLVKSLIEILQKKEFCQIVLFGGGAKEIELLDELASAYTSNVHNLAGKLTFGQELAVISNLDLMVSTDSGNGHLAANYGVPVLTLWGVTHPCLGFTPYGQSLTNSLMADRDKFPLIPTSVYGNHWHTGYEKAIETITPQQIAEKIEEIID